MAHQKRSIQEAVIGELETGRRKGVYSSYLPTGGVKPFYDTQITDRILIPKSAAAITPVCILEPKSDCATEFFQLAEELETRVRLATATASG